MDALWSKVARKAQTKETEVFATSEDMAEDAKVVDGIRIKKGLKQLRKAKEEERAAKELQEEMQECNWKRI